MQKLRVKFTKEGGARYISHLDLMRTMERALRRAKLEIAFSEGFNPHPKLSFASALSLGVNSRAEYMDLELTKGVTEGEARDRLNSSLPAGIKVLEVEELKDKGGAAMSLVEGAAYEVRGETALPWSKEKWLEIINSLLERDEILIEREGKKGLREIDIAPLLLDLELKELNGNTFLLGLLVRAGSRGNLRADEVLQALQKYYSLALEMDRIIITRTALYREDNDHLIPLISLENGSVKLRS